MKIKKTPQGKRGTYKLFDDNGMFVTEYKPGKDGQTDPDGDDLGDSRRLEEQLPVSDEEEVPDTIIRLRELVAAMPE